MSDRCYFFINEFPNPDYWMWDTKIFPPRAWMLLFNPPDLGKLANLYTDETRQRILSMNMVRHHEHELKGSIVTQEFFDWLDEHVSPVSGPPDQGLYKYIEVIDEIDEDLACEEIEQPAWIFAPRDTVRNVLYRLDRLSSGDVGTDPIAWYAQFLSPIREGLESIAPSIKDEIVSMEMYPSGLIETHLNVGGVRIMTWHAMHELLERGDREGLWHLMQSDGLDLLFGSDRGYSLQEIVNWPLVDLTEREIETLYQDGCGFSGYQKGRPLS